MENRRPIRIQKKEEILRLRETEGRKGEIPTEEIEHSTDSVQSNEKASPAEEASSYETVVHESTEKEKKTAKTDRKQTQNILSYFVIAISIVIGLFMYISNSRLGREIGQMEIRSREMKGKINELEALLYSKHKETDVADYLEGARIIHDLTTDSFYKNHWLKPVKGLPAEVAIDRVCMKHHCYSFRGSEGKLAVGFKNEKLIRKIGILHPLYENRKSAVKRFTVDCIVNSEHVRVGEFEYEIPGDSFQQFSINPTKCTGVVFRIISNHGNREYTCIYKVYAFE